MLSVCIPVYNWPIGPLINELLAQLGAAGVGFELVVADDASSDMEIKIANRSVIHYPEINYIELKDNIGRAAIRNLLAQNAKYEWLLFLDADTFPVSSYFIKKYIEATTLGYVLIGGIAYHNEKPADDKMLRWCYGLLREVTGAGARQKFPYRSFMTGNFMIKKEIFNSVVFDSSITQYGHEDTLFGLRLKQSGYFVGHIDNPVFHEGLESNGLFLDKTLSGIDNLIKLCKDEVVGLQLSEGIKLLKMYRQLTRLKMDKLVGLLFNWSEKRLRANLLSPKPSLFYFDLYKLGYLCNQGRNN